MSTISIHDLPTELTQRIKEKAKNEGLSLNKTLKKLLEQAMGFKPTPALQVNIFQDLSGVWSTDDLQEFEQVSQDQSQIDPSDWL